MPPSVNPSATDISLLFTANLQKYMNIITAMMIEAPITWILISAVFNIPKHIPLFCTRVKEKYLKMLKEKGGSLKSLHIQYLETWSKIIENSATE